MCRVDTPEHADEKCQEGTQAHGENRASAGSVLRCIFERLRLRRAAHLEISPNDAKDIVNSRVNSQIRSKSIEVGFDLKLNFLDSEGFGKKRLQVRADLDVGFLFLASDHEQDCLSSIRFGQR